MTSSPVTGSELEQYRKSRSLSQVAIGELLGVSGPTVNRWEKDEQEIPGPAQLLLRMLIYGELPFQEEGSNPQIREAMWELEMSLGTWEEINRRRIAGGFATVTDWIASLVRDALVSEQATARGLPTRTADHGTPNEVALVAEITPGENDVSGHLGAAAEAFAAQHPLPAGEAGGSAGTDSGRRDVTYTRPRRPISTGAKKR